MSDKTGIIFDIKKFAIHDGPGIRTTIFFKGCPLNCWWCHNPEGINSAKQLIFTEAHCLHCGKCYQLCPQQAHEKLANGQHIYHADRCRQCGACVENCYTQALIMEGQTVTVETVMQEIRKDRAFYLSSGGGVTFSGGEPLQQADFLLELLKQCKKEAIHTALDTSGYAPWKVIEKVVPYVDLILYDLKHLNSETHQYYTGVANELIKSNLLKLDKTGIPIEIRIPIIPSINMDKANIMATGKFLQQLKSLTMVNLFPLHRLGEGKYKRLGLEYKLNELEPPSTGQLNQLSECLTQLGLNVQING